MSYRVKVDLLADGKAKPVGCRVCADGLVPAESVYGYSGYVPAGVNFAGYAQGAGRYFVCDNDAVYVSGNGNSFVKLDDASGTPFLIEEIKDGAPRAALICGSRAFTHTGTVYSAFGYGADLKCGVMRRGRLFGSDGSKILWSGAGGIDDWKQCMEGGGSLTPDSGQGEVLELTEYGDKLIAVRKYGLTVLNFYGTPENFSVDIAGAEADGIYKGTARVAGGKLLFFTSSGLKSYDGTQVKAVKHRFAEDVSSPVCSAVLAGRYYLGCNSPHLNGGAVLCYDPDAGDSYLIDADARAMCTAEGCMRVYNAEGAHKIEGGGRFTFESGVTDFGTQGLKTVKRIFVNSDGVDVVISNGAVSRRFYSASGIIRPNLRGKSFTIKLSGKNAVSALSAEAEVMDAV